MSKYVLIESRDPFDSRDCDWLYDTAIALKDSGQDVTVFLVQNGVLITRTGSEYSERINKLNQANIDVMADSFSLQERAISGQKLVANVKSADIDHLVDLIMDDDTKPIWH